MVWITLALANAEAIEGGWEYKGKGEEDGCDWEGDRDEEEGGI